MSDDFTMEDAKKMIYQTYGNGIEIIKKEDYGYKFHFILKKSSGDFLSVSVDKKNRFPYPDPFD